MEYYGHFNICRFLFLPQNESNILSQSKDRLDVTIEEKPDIKSPLNETEQKFLSNAFSKTCQMDKANIKVKSLPDRRYTSVATVHKFMGGSGQKRPSLDLRDRIDSKRICKANAIHSCERVVKNVPAKNRPGNFTISQLIPSRIKTNSAPETYRPKYKEERNFGPNPRWGQSRRYSPFDEIANTTTYERGQLHPPPSYSYLSKSQFQSQSRFQPPSQTETFNGSEDSDSDWVIDRRCFADV